jgi:hypothetical protein
VHAVPLLAVEDLLVLDGVDGRVAVQTRVRLEAEAPVRDRVGEARADLVNVEVVGAPDAVAGEEVVLLEPLASRTQGSVRLCSGY